jgi:ribosome biogenesis GTPase
VNGTVHGSQGGVYQVLLDSGETLEASLRGRLKREARMGDRVVIGDRVEVAVDPDGSKTIEKVYTRESQIIRRGTGGRRPKVVAANVDRLVAVVSAARPEPRQALIDRLLVVGEANDLEVVLVLNKMDLLSELPPGINSGISCEEENSSEEQDLSPLQLAALYRRIGYEVVETSTVSGRGLDALEDVLARGTSALAGPSGVGKSSLLNAIEPGLDLRTGELSHRKGQGRHTTVSSRLIGLECGGFVADTPGFSDVGVWGVEPRELESCFPEFAAYREGCRFRGCAHIKEPDCRVQEALADGDIHSKRFESYVGLIQEAGNS